MKWWRYWSAAFGIAVHGAFWYVDHDAFKVGFVCMVIFFLAAMYGKD